MIVVLVLGIFGVAWATNGIKTQFNIRYGTTGSAIDQCILCHASNTNPDIPSLETPQNPYGVALENNGVDFAAAEPVDSDGDGFTNIVEILARTFPGNPNSKPATTGTTLPIVDFDGDSKTDQAFYRPETGVWFVLPSGSGSYYGEYFGAAASDILVPGDYDGDGKTDYGFYRPSNGVWFIKPSGGVPSWYAVYFGGGASDIPLTYNY